MTNKVRLMEIRGNGPRFETWNVQLCGSIGALEEAFVKGLELKFGLLN